MDSGVVRARRRVRSRSLILAGHPQTFYYSLLIAAVSAAFWSLEARAEGQGEGTGRKAWRPVLVLSAATAVAALVCAVQLVPTLELVQLSNRSGKVPYAISVAAGALKPAHLVTLFLPDYFGAIRVSVRPGRHQPVVDSTSA